MNWLNKLEKKFGRFAIPNLMFYIIVLYGLGFVISLINPNFYSSYLSLDVSAILRGQVWRVVTFIIQPPSSSILFMIFALYLYYVIGRQVEAAWGAFRFNVYYFLGMILNVVAAFLVYFLTGLNMPLGTSYLNLSLFFAFAALYPNVQLLLFFVIPIKVKWLGLLDGAFFLWTIIKAFLPAYGGGPSGIFYKAEALAAFVAILNFVIFFLSSRRMQPYSPKQVKRRIDFQTKIKQVQRERKTYEDGAKHKCAVCGRTELTNPELDFRYCSKCKGNREYCQDHLFTHTHIQ